MKDSFQFGKSLRALLSWTLVFLLAVSAAAAVQELTSEEIKAIQLRLTERGFYSGTADGVMGPETVSALRRFQEKNGLDDSGEPDERTLEKLGLEKDKEKGLIARMGGGMKTAGLAVEKGVVTAGQTVGHAGQVAGQKTAEGAVIASQSTARAGTGTAKAGMTAGGATAQAATTAGRATSSGLQTAGRATAGALEAASKATAEFFTGQPDDDQLAQKVEEHLEKDGRFDMSYLTVTAKGGKVTLVFSGGTSAEWDKAIAAARRVDGVEKVFIRTP